MKLIKGIVWFWERSSFFGRFTNDFPRLGPSALLYSSINSWETL